MFNFKKSTSKCGVYLMKVANFASPKPIVLKEGDSLKGAAAIFLSNSIDGAPVVNEEGNIVGILTKRVLADGLGL